MQNVHELRLSRRNAVPFTCMESVDEAHRCNAQYFMFKNFQRHLLENHQLHFYAAMDADKEPYNEPEQHEPPNIENDFFQNLGGINNMVIFQNTTNLDEIKNFTSNYIAEMRCNLSIPEKFIQNVMSCTNDLITKIESYLWNKIKHVIKAAHNSIDKECLVNVINNFTVGNVFTDIKDINIHMACIARKCKCKIPEPTEITLEKKTIKQQKKILTRTGIVKKEILKTVRDSYQYISVCELLSLIMRNPDAMDQVEKEDVSPNGYICSFKDGTEFKNNTYFQQNPNALRLTLNADEIEIVNNLSSRAGKHKITHFYIKIQNFGQCRDSTYNTNYLILSINSKILKKHGYQKVLEPLINDFKSLESGVKLKFGDTEYDLRAILCSFAGDTLAAHEIFGLLSPSASYFCRQCYITKTDLKNGNVGAGFEQRTEVSHELDLKKIQIQQIEAAEAQTHSRSQRSTKKVKFLVLRILIKLHLFLNNCLFVISYLLTFSIRPKP